MSDDMSDKSTLGDCCQKHNPMTAPVVYPYRVSMDKGSLRGEYRCACGNNWSCWWDLRYSGWTLEDMERLNETADRVAAADAALDARSAEGAWFHRGPCHACTGCSGRQCYVWNDDVNPEIHICASGCDGLPPGLESAA